MPVVAPGTPRLSSEGCDVDIKKLVASFVHRQFGQSKRVSEKDKKAVERFVGEQLQQERSRYQSMLPSTPRPSCSSPLTEEDDVFPALQIQEHLFRIHMKIEPHLNREAEEEEEEERKDKGEGEDGEGEGEGEGKHSSSGTTIIRERVLPDDLSFEVIHAEMERLSKRLYRLDGLVRRSLKYFKPEARRAAPLPELVGRMHDALRRQQRELEEADEQRNRFLDEVHDYSQHIEKLERERQEYRAQVNVLHQDMAKVRQEKMALQERCLQLERSHKERLEKESTLDNLRHLVKDLRSNGMTPRSTTILEEGGVGGPRGAQVRRSMRASQAKQVVSGYPLYTRRYTPNARAAAKKKNAVSSNAK